MNIAVLKPNPSTPALLMAAEALNQSAYDAARPSRHGGESPCAIHRGQSESSHFLSVARHRGTVCRFPLSDDGCFCYEYERTISRRLVSVNKWGLEERIQDG